MVKPPSSFQTLTLNIRCRYQDLISSLFRTIIWIINLTYNLSIVSPLTQDTLQKVPVDQKMKRAFICLISPAQSPAAQPVSFLGERLLHGIIATCHSQVNSPPSLCSGEQSLFSLSSVGALRLTFEPCSLNTSVWTSRLVSYLQSEHFVCLETDQHIG